MPKNEKIDNTQIALFKGKRIRKTLHNAEWWFSIADICTALTGSPDGGAYWRKLKQRLAEEGSEVVTFCHGLKLEAGDGKKYITGCANTEGIFRIIQSIPSPKAEPFKRWLAKVGYERVQEIENPELARNHRQRKSVKRICACRAIERKVPNGISFLFMGTITVKEPFRYLA